MKKSLAQFISQLLFSIPVCFVVVVVVVVVFFFFALFAFPYKKRQIN